MLIISRFFGIKICMYPNDHVPPHIHAFYGEFQAQFAIRNGEVLEGKFPRRATRLVQDWIELHVNELEKNYIASQQIPASLQDIAGLE